MWEMQQDDGISGWEGKIGFVLDWVVREGFFEGVVFELRFDDGEKLIR